MLTIHATQKLYKKLTLDDQGCLAAENIPATAHTQHANNNPLSGWHANIIRLQGCQCVLLVHDATRFPLFIKGLLKADLASFDWHFADALMNTLLKLGAHQHQLDTAAALLGPCQFDSDCNRSVQGTMNQMKGDIEHMLCYDDIKLAAVSNDRTAAWLADRPCTVKGIKGSIWPHKAMLALLSQAIQPSEDPALADNVVQLAGYRDAKKP